MLHGGLCREQEAQHIGIELAVEFRLGHLFKRGESKDAGIIDQDVDLAEGGHGFGNDPLGGVSHAALDGNRPAARFGDGGDGLLGARLVGGVVDGDGRALGRERRRDGRADALGCAGDQRHFSCKLAHGNLLVRY